MARPVLKVLDLFAGLKGWSEPFAERGHDVITLDIEPRFDCTITADVLKPLHLGFVPSSEPLGAPWVPNVILASPPCEKFSVMAFGHHWLPGYVPKHDGTLLAMRLVERTVELIRTYQPAYFVIENLVGMLRSLHLVPFERRTVTYCQYGAPWRKPTDLWGGFPPSLVLRRMCRNGDPCHVASPRGSTTGVQGDGRAKVRQANGERIEQPAWGWRASTSGGSIERRDAAAIRAKIPEQLALAVCIAAERDFQAGRVLPLDYSGRLFT